MLLFGKRDILQSQISSLKKKKQKYLTKMSCLYPHFLYRYRCEGDYARCLAHDDISSRIIFMELFGESEWDDKLVNRYERTNFIKPVIELRTLQ